MDRNAKVCDSRIESPKINAKLDAIYFFTHSLIKNRVVGTIDEFKREAVKKYKDALDTKQAKTEDEQFLQRDLEIYKYETTMSDHMLKEIAQLSFKLLMI